MTLQKCGFLAILFLLLAACNNKESTVEERLQDSETVLVEEYDGCKMYKTSMSYYNSVFWVKCDVPTMTQQQKGCGKGCTRQERVMVYP